MPKSVWLLVGLLCCAGLVACGPTNSVSGKVSDRLMRVKDAISVTFKRTNGAVDELFVLIVDKPDLCAKLNRDRLPASASILRISLTRLADDRVTSLAPDVGDYRIYPVGQRAGRQAASTYLALDNLCLPGVVPPRPALSGVVKLTQLEPTVAGSFELAFGAAAPLSGDTPEGYTGIFNAPPCEVPGGFGASGCE